MLHRGHSLGEVEIFEGKKWLKTYMQKSCFFGKKKRNIISPRYTPWTSFLLTPKVWNAERENSNVL